MTSAFRDLAEEVRNAGIDTLGEVFTWTPPGEAEQTVDAVTGELLEGVFDEEAIPVVLEANGLMIEPQPRLWVTESAFTIKPKNGDGGSFLIAGKLYQPERVIPDTYGALEIWLHAPSPAPTYTETTVLDFTAAASLGLFTLSPDAAVGEFTDSPVYADGVVYRPAASGFFLGRLFSAFPVGSPQTVGVGFPGFPFDLLGKTLRLEFDVTPDNYRLMREIRIVLYAPTAFHASHWVAPVSFPGSQTAVFDLTRTPEYVGTLGPADDLSDVNYGIGISIGYTNIDDITALPDTSGCHFRRLVYRT